MANEVIVGLIQVAEVGDFFAEVVALLLLQLLQGQLAICHLVVDLLYV